MRRFNVGSPGKNGRFSHHHLPKIIPARKNSILTLFRQQLDSHHASGCTNNLSEDIRRFRRFRTVAAPQHIAANHKKTVRIKRLAGTDAVVPPARLLIAGMIPGPNAAPLSSKNGASSANVYVSVSTNPTEPLFIVKNQKIKD
jgi:hypothetical protein